MFRKPIKRGAVLAFLASLIAITALAAWILALQQSGYVTPATGAQGAWVVDSQACGITANPVGDATISACWQIAGNSNTGAVAIANGRPGVVFYVEETFTSAETVLGLCYAAEYTGMQPGVTGLVTGPARVAPLGSGVFRSTFTLSDLLVEGGPELGNPVSIKFSECP